MQRYFTPEQGRRFVTPEVVPHYFRNEMQSTHLMSKCKELAFQGSAATKS